MTSIEVPITNDVPRVLTPRYQNLLRWAGHFEEQRESIVSSLVELDSIREDIFDLQQRMESVVYQIADHDGDVDYLWSQVENDLDELDMRKGDLHDELKTLYEALREYEAGVENVDEDVASKHKGALKDIWEMADNAEEVYRETECTIDAYTRVFNF